MNNDSILPEIPDFNFESVNSPSNFGGVGVFISNRFNYTVRNDLCLNVSHCEDLWVDIKLENNDKFTLGIVYRHPGHKYMSFCDKLCNNLNNLNLSKSKYMVVGDINIDLLKYNVASDVTSYVNSLNSVGY